MIGLLRQRDLLFGALFISCFLLSILPFASTFQVLGLRSTHSVGTSLQCSLPLRSAARKQGAQTIWRTVGLRRCKIACSASEERASEPSEENEPQEEEVKPPVEELNMKLWQAAEEGDAALIRELIEDGAEVNSQPELEEDEDLEDEEDETDASTETTSEGAAPAGEAPQSAQSVEEPPKEQGGPAPQPKDAAPKEEKKKEEKKKEEKEEKEKTPEQLEKEKRKAERKAERARKKANAENKGPSALHLAAGKGFSDAAVALVDLGGDVNILNDELATPLHFAVAKGHTDTVQVLVTLGADLKAKNRKGETPLDMGVEEGAPEEVVTLLKLLMGVTDDDELSK